MLRYISALIIGLSFMMPAFAIDSTMCVFGDSYVRNHHCHITETWHAKVAARLGLHYVNKGINGNCVAFDRTAEGYGKAMINRIDELPDSINVILLIAGHNDAGMIANNENCTLSQFSESLDHLLKVLKWKYPNATIGYVTPWHVQRPCFEEIISEIKRICMSNGIPVLDASDIIEVNSPTFRKRYFQSENDTAHLNDDGHNLMFEQGLGFIRNIIRDKSFNPESQY